MKGEDFAVLAKALSEDPGSAVRGRRPRLDRPGHLRAGVRDSARSLADNEISEPFRTQFGWHIIQVLGRRQFDTTEELRRQRAFVQLRESKADEETELWLRRLRDEAFVEPKM